VSYIFFSSHILVVAFQLPLAATQSASVFAFVTSPANAGPVTASAMAIANVEMRIFMGFSPLRWTKPPQMNVFCVIAFQEHPILSRVESMSATEVGDFPEVTSPVAGISHDPLRETRLARTAGPGILLERQALASS